jgi:hypothetical protein
MVRLVINAIRTTLAQIMGVEMAKRIRMIFDESIIAHRAVRELVISGVDRQRITIMSSEPFLVGGKPIVATGVSWIGGFAIIGGLIGAVAGWALVFFTSHAYPLATGGMPLVPPLTTGIIMYEVAAVGAVLSALLRLLWETRLPSWGRVRVEDPAEISDGGLLVSAETDDLVSSRAILLAAGGRELKQVEVIEASTEGEEKAEEQVEDARKLD